LVLSTLPAGEGRLTPKIALEERKILSLNFTFPWKRTAVIGQKEVRRNTALRKEGGASAVGLVYFLKKRGNHGAF